jgi:hypothetical protein
MDMDLVQELCIIYETNDMVLITFRQEMPMWISKSVVLNSWAYRLFSEREACYGLLKLSDS